MDTVTIKIEREIHNCYECDCHTQYRMQGCTVDWCNYIQWGDIPREGIRKDCPFRKGVDKIN